MAKRKYVIAEPEVPTENVALVCRNCSVECTFVDEGYNCPVCGSNECSPEIVLEDT
jgi:hypothetical protein